MAKIFPTLKNIERLKVKPTQGERYLLDYLVKNLADEIEIYFQPFLDGDRPDIVLLQKNIGVVIIEVKDWNLDKYKVDSNNSWSLKNRKKDLKSPFKQVRTYKDNLFNLHINGLLEKKIKNPNFYGRVKTYVYFHKSTREELNSFYEEALNSCRIQIDECNNKFRSNQITYDEYDKNLKNLNTMKKNIENDLIFEAIGSDNLEKIKFPTGDNIFEDSIYKEFQRYLQPPYHTLNDGIDIHYTKKQTKYIESSSIFQKIKGVAGSGKTSVMAKRAVNAHKRHDTMVLILTYNISLKGYIHDKVSDVRENFRWNNFYIVNYHQFIKTALNNIGIEISVPKNVQEQIDSLLTIEEKDKYLEKYLEKTYYSNQNLFYGYEDEVIQYKTILIDEIQDYNPEWIKLIRKYFLEENGEMVLYGDEKQNIYHRELDEEKKIKTVQGFGRWGDLKDSIRHKGEGGRVLDLARHFQSAFFKGKYTLDDYTEKDSNTVLGNLDIYKIASYSKDNISPMVKAIFKEIKTKNIHPNDITIIASTIDILREIDCIIRNDYNEKTLTTFVDKEMKAYIQEESDPKKKKAINIEIKNLERRKKFSFNLNSGVIKLTTIHSFKGYESPTVFLIVDSEDNEEVVYAGITRSKFNLMVFTDTDSKYNEFFNVELNKSKPSEKEDEILEKLKISVSSKKCIDIDYDQHGIITKKASIKPYKILFMQDNFYLACEVNNKYKYSMYRISKIKDVFVSNETFSYNLNIQYFIENIQTPFAKYSQNFKSELIDIIVEISKEKSEYFKNKKHLPSQEIVEKKENGNLIVSFTVTQELEVEDLIKRWIPHIIVVSPLSLKYKIKEDLKRYLSL